METLFANASFFVAYHFRRRFAGPKGKPVSFALPVLAHIKLSKREAKALGIS